MSNSLELRVTLAAAPTTTRAAPTRIDAHGNSIAYGSGHCVIVRSLSTPPAVLVCNHHSCPVTAVRFSPSGAQVASGDREGNLILWANLPGMQELLRTKQLQGPVRDIAWTEDEERLIVTGEGRTSFAVAITRTANTIGLINGHTQMITSCDMRRSRPYRVFTGSADAHVGFYEGVPFRFLSNTAGHKGTVTGVRYHPTLDLVATVSSQSQILIFDGIKGGIVRKVETHHTGSILGVAWTHDGRFLATVSADKSLKLVNTETGDVVHTISAGTNVTDMLQGVVCTASGQVVASALDGRLLVVDAQSGAMTKTIRGHQGRILLLHVDPSGTLFSVSTEGLVLEWPEGAHPDTATPRPGSLDQITAATACGESVYVVSGDQLVCHRRSLKGPLIVSTAVRNAVAVAVTQAGDIVVLYASRAVVLDERGEMASEVALASFDGSCAAACGQVVALGGQCTVRLFDVESKTMKERLVFSGLHTTTVSCVALSHDAKRVASGDGAHTIYVWSAVDGAILYRNLVHHALRVTSVAFDSSGCQLLSGSWDGAVIKWDLEGKKRRMANEAHRGGVSAVAWGSEGKLISAGGDQCIRLWE